MTAKMTCTCGRTQTTVAYSARYRGLVFGCPKAADCRVLWEGAFPTFNDAAQAIGGYAADFGLVVIADPTLAGKAQASK